MTVTGRARHRGRAARLQPAEDGVRPSCGPACVGGGGTVTWPLRPGTNTRLFAHVAGGDETTDSRSVVLEVRTALSLTVVRNGRRDYTFQGRVLPRRAGTLVTLYRVEPSGKRVITRQVTSDGAGVYRVRRAFTGAGRFGFVFRTGKNLTNAAGESDEGVVRTVQIR